MHDPPPDHVRHRHRRHFDPGKLQERVGHLKISISKTRKEIVIRFSKSIAAAYAHKHTHTRTRACMCACVCVRVCVRVRVRACWRGGPGGCRQEEISLVLGY